MGQPFPPPVYVVLAASVLAALTDVWKFKVHNYLTLPLLVSGLLYHGSVEGLAGVGKCISGTVNEAMRSASRLAGDH